MFAIFELLSAFAVVVFMVLMALLGLVGCLGSPMMFFFGFGMALWGAILVFSFIIDPNTTASRAGSWLLYGIATSLILIFLILSPGTQTRFYWRFLIALLGLIPQVLTYLKYERNELNMLNQGEN